VFVLKVFMGVVAVLLAVGCGSSGGESPGKNNASCRPYCDALCAERAKCPNPPEAATCQSECLAQAEPGICENAEQNLDDQRCEELANAPACQAYCGTLCKEAQECGKVDEATCLEGCDIGSFRLICDQALVAARECPDLLAEANCHLLASRGDGDGVSFGGSSRTLTCDNATQRGVCDRPSDCAEGQACNTKTHLCGACSKDVECGEPYDGSGGLACIEGKCELVECAVDDDCLGVSCESFSCDVCDTGAHKCVECLRDADCRSGACDTDRKVCVDCKKDADCADESVDKLCDPKAMECVICDPARCEGVCDSLFGCVECETDKECKDGWTCTSGFCEVPFSSCAKASDCPDGAKCTASGSTPDLSGSCVACLVDNDCKGDEVCDNGRCANCVDDRECGDGQYCISGHCL